ncbi:hypothetical protein GQ457_02G021390 [Hibiscus cannabinus]
MVWEKLIWHKLHVPRHYVISWITVLDRRPTKAWLAYFGIALNDMCLFGCDGVETRNRVFLGCEFSRSIWNQVLSMCGLPRSAMDWEQELHWLVTRLKGKSLLLIILKLARNAILDMVWRQKNAGVFHRVTLTVDQVVVPIKDIIAIILKRKNVNFVDVVNRRLCIEWGIGIGLFFWLVFIDVVGW